MKELSLLPKPDSTGRLRMGIRYTPLGFSSPVLCRKRLSTRKQSVGTLQALSSTAKVKTFKWVVSWSLGQLTVAAEKGYRTLLWMLGSLSVVLVFQLLPIPSLDGSRMLFMTIERVIGRELNPTFQIWSMWWA